MAEEYNFSGVDALNTSKEPSEGEAITRGLAKGATFGQSDRLLAGEQALLDKLFGGVSDVDKKLVEQGFTGDLTPSSSDLYNKDLKEEYAIEAAAKKAHPGLYTGSELVGGALPSSFIPLPTKFIPKTPLDGAATKLARTAIGSGEGAVVGSIAASGEENATPKSIAQGGLIGAASVPAVELGAKAIKMGVKGVSNSASKLGQLVADTPIVGDALKALKKGYEGIKLVGETARKKLGEDLVSTTEENLDKIEALKQAVGQEMTNIRVEAGKKGTTIPLDDLYDQALEKVTAFKPRGESQKAEWSQVKEYILEGMQEPHDFNPNRNLNLTPEEAFLEKQKLSEFVPFGDKSKAATSGLKEPIQDIEKGIQDKLLQLPEYANQSNKYSALSTAQELAGVPEAVVSKAQTFNKKEAAAKLVGKISESSKTADAAERKINEILANVSKADPQLAEEIGKSWKNASSSYDLAHQISSKGIIGGDVGNLLGTAKGILYGGSNAVGLGFNKLKSLPPAQMSSIASQLNSKFGEAGNKLGRVLEQVQNAEVSKKSALMFTIIQNPEYRKMLKEAAPELVEDSSNE